jgi:putative acetyltransferase
VHEAAFPTLAEADLVERLGGDRDAALSLIHEEDGAVVHVLLSRMTVTADGRPVAAVGLAPFAITPDRHTEGIGTALIGQALALAEAFAPPQAGSAEDAPAFGALA